MKKTILVVGIACATVMAVAQSNARQDNSAEGTGGVSRPDVATGMASGKRMYKPMTITKSKDAGGPAGAMVRESPSKASLGKTSAADSYAKHRNAMGDAQSNPMYQDSGKSGENPLFEPKDRTVSKPPSNVRDSAVSTGNLDGEGDPDRPLVKSKSNITNNRVNAGNANANGTPNAPSNAPVQMKGDYSRGHQPDRKTSAASNGKTSREAGGGMAIGKRQHN